jgi:hypothetical protein
MKTKILLMLVFAGTLFITSCGKADRECNCTYMMDGVEFTADPQEYSNVTAEEGIDRCADRAAMLQEEYPSAYDISCGTGDE